MSMGTSSPRRVETDALIMVVGCWEKHQRMRQPKDWIWAKGHNRVCRTSRRWSFRWSLGPSTYSEAMARGRRHWLWLRKLEEHIAGYKSRQKKHHHGGGGDDVRFNLALCSSLQPFKLLSKKQPKLWCFAAILGVSSNNIWCRRGKLSVLDRGLFS